MFFPLNKRKFSYNNGINAKIKPKKILVEILEIIPFVIINIEEVIMTINHDTSLSLTNILPITENSFNRKSNSITPCKIILVTIKNANGEENTPNKKFPNNPTIANSIVNFPAIFSQNPNFSLTKL